jgi:hypothetical protein
MRRDGRLIIKIKRFPNKPLSREQQGQSEQDDTNSVEGRSRIRQDTSNQNVTGYQTEYAASHQRSFLGRLKDRVNTHHTRALLQDPRAWIEIVALLTLGLYTYFASRQSDAMHDTLVEVKKQTSYANTSAVAATAAANAAQDSIMQSRDQFRQDQRPYVWLTNDTSSPTYIETRDPRNGTIIDQRATWTWSIQNYGKSPAQNVRIGSAVYVGEHAEETKKILNSNRFGIGTPLPPTKTTHSTGVSVQRISQEELVRLIRDFDHSVIVFGRIEYTDSYGVPYQSGFCMETLRTRDIQFCPIGNYIK